MWKPKVIALQNTRASPCAKVKLSLMHISTKPMIATKTAQQLTREVRFLAKTPRIGTMTM